MVDTTMATACNQLLFGQTITVEIPTVWYLGILTSQIPITDINGNIENKEPTNTGYKRIALTNNETSFSVVSSSVIPSYATNVFDIYFDNFTGGSNIQLAGFFLSKEETGGHACVWGHLQTAKTIYANSRVVVRANALRFAFVGTEGGGGAGSGGLIVDSDGILSGNLDANSYGYLQ